MLDMEGTDPGSVIGLGKEKDLGTVPGNGTGLGRRIGLFKKSLPFVRVFIFILMQESKEELVP